MGVIVYCMVLGYLPFEDPQHIVDADYIPFEEQDKVSPGIFLNHCLALGSHMHIYPI